MHGVIYKITNKINGKSYIGQTIQPLIKRLRAHFYRRLNTAFSNAIAKYGKDSFSVEILTNCSDYEQLNDAEVYFIEYFQTLTPDGYNLHGGGSKHVEVSKETREKMAAAKKGKPRTDAVKAKISLYMSSDKNPRLGKPNPFKGAKRSTEIREKMSKAALKRYGKAA